MARNVRFSFLRGGGSNLEVLYGKVSLTPTNLHTLSTTAVLPAPTTYDLINGSAVATNVAPTPAPVYGAVSWAYKIKVTDTHGKSWEYLVGVPDGTTEINFNVLPRYTETRPPAYGVGPAGPAGQSATIAIGTTTSGPTPAVTNSGTSTDAVLNFTLAKGDKGDPGEGVPAGGTALQVIRKNAANTTTEWATADKALVGLGNVDNTSDDNKPLSTPQKTYIDQSNTLVYREKTAAALPSSYPEGVTVFLGSFTDGFPIVQGGSPAFAVIRTDKPRGYSSVVQYASPYSTSADTANTGVVLYRVGAIDDTWGDWQTIVRGADNLYENAASFGARGDGTTNDTASLQALLDSAGADTKRAFLERGKTYVISAKLDIPSGVVVEGNGATILVPVVFGNVAFSFQGDNAELRNVNISMNTSSSSNTRGIAATGRKNITLHKVSLEATVPAAGAGDLNRTGVSFMDCTDVTVRDLRVKNFEYPTRFERCSNVQYSGGVLDTYVRGLYMTEVKDSSFSNFVVQNLSPNAQVQPGHNGVLIGTETPRGTNNLRFSNIIVKHSGEHGFRIGSFITVSNVIFENCTSENAGASGFKCLGGQTGGTSYHEDITYKDCTVIDAGNLTDMTAGFMIQFVRRGRVINPTVIKRNKTYSAAYGVEFQAIDGLVISNPIIKDTENACIKMGFVLGNLTDVTVDGGSLASATGHGIWFDYTNRTLRQIKVVNYPTITISGAGYNIHITNGVSGTAVGAGFLTWYSTQGAALQVSPDSTTTVFAADAVASFDAALHGSMFRNGSMWRDPNLTTGQVRYRVGSSWKTPVYA